ncbi:3-phosphoserine/phosphohydroxythreonine aminotransferase [Candidatus Marinamargulisbacteria bacterium SCGC AG-439-L15]|nr:3-phosphoserine/phosphohydroxythreonine aminotransferase [Candidatus Marinamargulisbacteria bacterium SCGC AG-439-L15]
MSNRVINFNAGPSTLPIDVLTEAQSDLLNYQGKGLSVMEMSHRSQEFTEILETTERNVRDVFHVPNNYKVLFLQGGATQQFAMIPMNLSTSKKADYIHTGSWTKKAIAEAKKMSTVSIVGSSEDQNFLSLPSLTELTSNNDADYLYLCANNTIFGTQFKHFPHSNGVPLVADMSSDIMSRVLDINQFGVIFAGAQKNLGPSGVTLVIIREDLLDRCDESVPNIFQYRNHAKNDSCYNTPPTYGIYMIGLMMKWIQGQGGLSVVQEKNELKAKLLYDAIDNQDLYYCPVEASVRSDMNVVFRIKNNHVELENLFVKEAKAAGIIGIKGHRSVGGLRASIYNAQPLANIQAFVDFMETFEKQHG